MNFIKEWFATRKYRYDIGRFTKGYYWARVKLQEGTPVKLVDDEIYPADNPFSRGARQAVFDWVSFGEGR